MNDPIIVSRNLLTLGSENSGNNSLHIHCYFLALEYLPEYDYIDFLNNNNFLVFG